MDSPLPQSSGCRRKVSTPWEKLPEHQVQEILNLAGKQGWKSEAIAVHLKLHPWTIRDCLRAHQMLPARGGRPLSREKLTPLLEALRLGQASFKDLSRAFGVSRATVTKYAQLINAPTTWEVRERLRKLKPPKPKKPRKVQALNPRYDAWRDWWAAGKSCAEIAQLAGVSYQSVRSAVQWTRAKHGWFPPRFLLRDRTLPTTTPATE